MDEKLKSAYSLFDKKDYMAAKKLFSEFDMTYEMGLCELLKRNLVEARKCFEIKKDDCIASDFGLLIIDIIEDSKTRKIPNYFQVRSFLEIYINFFIENNILDWAQKVIDNYQFFTQSNLETPKFIARVLHANRFYKAVHSFAKLGKEICYHDAEVHYIDACVYITEKNYEEAMNCINACLNFAPEYYPMLRLKQEVEELISQE